MFRISPNCLYPNFQTSQKFSPGNFWQKQMKLLKIFQSEPLNSISLKHLCTKWLPMLVEMMQNQKFSKTHYFEIFVFFLADRWVWLFLRMIISSTQRIDATKKTTTFEKRRFFTRRVVLITVFSAQRAWEVYQF